MLRASKLKLEFMGIEILKKISLEASIPLLSLTLTSHPLPTSSPAPNTLFSPASAYTDTPCTSYPAYDFSGFATTMNTSATSVETIKSPLKDEDTGVTRTQRRGWEFHQLRRQLRCLAFLLRVWMEAIQSKFTIPMPTTPTQFPIPAGVGGSKRMGERLTLQRGGSKESE
ncbi:hypothetical protein M422DRAFT_34792 [Sphaerobolus stellatus SS14]|uniref:Uncharacterized protein n=1 Tax=Sphaerobolus stellatus (strain SS14) TaxID=990650 RepID=A0A0C9UKI2_SPHS4|nr:hypothetical protein M422DRAFT_34792 [Sphaerobolus stellatus SS14]